MAAAAFLRRRQWGLRIGDDMDLRKLAMWSKRAQSSKTSQGLASIICTPLRQGVRRPHLHLILARRMSEIHRAIRTLPSSGCLMLTLMVDSVVAGTFFVDLSSPAK